MIETELLTLFHTISLYSEYTITCKAILAIISHMIRTECYLTDYKIYITLLIDVNGLCQ